MKEDLPLPPMDSSANDRSENVIPQPQALETLSGRISISLETKRLMGEIERDVGRMNWEIPDLAPFEAAPRLAGPARHLLAAGGKRVRPLLVCLLGRALGLPFNQRLAVSAMASELVHTATLLHDDVLDAARVRRGRIAAHLRYDAHTAILSGDALLCKAMADVARLGDAEAFISLAMTLREIVEGECLQADLVGRVHEELDTVLEVCRRKTGALFAWCGWVAGHTAGRHAEELRKFGKHLGLAFQLLDDILDWESNESGKPRYTDLHEAKLNSVAVVLCMKSKSARAMLERAFGTLNEYGEVENVAALGAELRELPEFSEALHWVKSQAEKESAFAIANLDLLPESPWRELAKRITLDLLERMR